MSKINLLCLAATLACGSLFAATIKVPADQPTIAAGVTAAGDGGTVILSKNPDTPDGAWYENVTVPNGIQSLTITGKVIWDGNLSGTPGTCLSIVGPSTGPFLISGIIFRNGEFAVVSSTGDVDGITLSGCQGQFITSRFMETGGDNLTVTKCTLLGCNEGVSCNSDSAVISGNKFIQCSNDGIFIGNNGGIEKALIEKNFFFLHDGSNLINIDSDNTQVISTSAKICIGGIQVTGDSCTVTGTNFSHVDGGIQITDGGVGGNEASKNKLSNISALAIQVDGPDALVSGNSVTNCNGGGLRTNDVSPTMTGNKIKFAETGIDCTSADNGLVDKNKVQTIMGDNGILVLGAAVTVTNNSVSDITGGSGLSLQGSGGATIDKNKLKNISANGIECSITGTSPPVVISNCSVAFAGTNDNHGIQATGDNTQVRKCKVSNIDGDGFNIDANNCEISDCSATKCGIDGFDSDNSNTGNTFTNCKASACAGEGFDNSTCTGTVVNGGSFTKNRIDFAGNGTTAFGATTPKIGDGSGLATVPEVD